MKEKITPASCLSCGACCVSFVDQDRFCDVSHEDEKRLGKRFVRLNVLHSSFIDVLSARMDGQYLPDGAIKTSWRDTKSGPLKGVSVCACVALKGPIMHKTSCSVYEKRPEVCRRAVKPGDSACREVRRMIRDAIDRDVAE